MPLKVRCPTCAKTVRLPDAAAGRTATCPQCGAGIPVPVVLPAAPAEKECPHCGETIDVALRAAEDARRAAERPAGPPNVFMTAGGGGAGSSSAAASSAVAGTGTKQPNPAEATLGCLIGAVLLVSCCGCPLYLYTQRPPGESAPAPQAAPGPGTKGPQEQR